MEPIKKKLENGMRAILIPQEGSRTTTVLTFVGAGSEYENKDINGVSHFLEHMVFKGTRNMPEPGMVAEALDTLGADYNAFTSHEYTGYWAKVGRHNTEDALNLVADLYLHPIFPKGEMQKERGVIFEEMNMYEDVPMRKVNLNLIDLLYGDQPAGWRTIGTKEALLGMDEEALKNYRQSHYKTKNSLIVVAGSFDEQKIKNQIEHLFGALPREDAPAKEQVVESQSAPAVSLEYRDSDQTHLVVAVRAFPLTDDRRFSLNVLSQALGGSMSSRLFTRIREKMGAAYYIRSDTSLATDYGFFSISAGAANEKAKAVTSAILDECKKLAQEPLPKKELNKVKTSLTGSLLVGLETSDSLANFYGAQELLRKDMQTPEEITEKIEAVTAKEVQSLAKELFVDESLNLAIIGPYKDEDEFKKVLTLA